jgi:hypothetical protein
MKYNKFLQLSNKDIRDAILMFTLKELEHLTTGLPLN